MVCLQSSQADKDRNDDKEYKKKLMLRISKTNLTSASEIPGQVFNIAV